ncbi:hypothetical protein HK405_015973 [Cladochytrium tenue]|nr:hypothetical protein HK405_015973 [Cladochytrium tenue]
MPNETPSMAVDKTEAGILRVFVATDPPLNAARLPPLLSARGTRFSVPVQRTSLMHSRAELSLAAMYVALERALVGSILAPEIYATLFGNGGNISSATQAASRRGVAVARGLSTLPASVLFALMHGRVVESEVTALTEAEEEAETVFEFSREVWDAFVGLVSSLLAKSPVAS